MKVGTLALQGDVSEHAQALSDLGADAVEVRTPNELAPVDALILPGGESTTVSKLLESSGLFDAVAARLDEGMPADLVLVHGDPLSDARAMWRVWAVFQQGTRIA